MSLHVLCCQTLWNASISPKKTHLYGACSVCRRIKAAFSPEPGSEGSALLSAAAAAAKQQADEFRVAIERVKTDSMTRHDAFQLLKLMDALASLHSSVLPPLQQLTAMWPVLCNLLSSAHLDLSRHRGQNSQCGTTHVGACRQQVDLTGTDAMLVREQQAPATARQCDEALSIAQQGESLLRLVTAQVEAAHHMAEIAKRYGFQDPSVHYLTRCAACIT